MGCSFPNMLRLLRYFLVLVSFFISVTDADVPKWDKFFDSDQLEWGSIIRRHGITNKQGGLLDLLDNQDGPSANADVERHNTTIILEGMQLEISDKGPLMYCNSETPFDANCPTQQSNYAYTSISSNDDATGTGLCGSGGNGRITRGYLDRFHSFLEMNRTMNFRDTRAKLDGLQLSTFSHINVLNNKSRWNVLGEAGDVRVYVNGTFNLTEGSETLLSATSVKWYQNWSYPLPAGPSTSQGGSHLAAYFVGSIVEYGSDEQWVDAIDPYGTGYLLGVVRAAAFGPVRCYSTASFWITLRGFPDLGEGTFNSIVVQNNTADVGAKVGPYLGSNSSSQLRARSLAQSSVNVVSTTMAAVAAGTAGLTVAAVSFPTLFATVSGMPGGGAVRMIRNAQFIARLNEIRGFHTDSFNEYGSNVNVFLVKFPYPFGKSNTTQTSAASKKLQEVMKSWSDLATRQFGLEELFGGDDDDDDDENASITDDIFKGCAFYTMLIVVGVLLVHVIIWLVTRHRSRADQVAPHAWMVYIFSLVMEYVHTSSVLNSIQYFRSHIGKSSGRPELYFVAFLQFLFIGIGFLVFFFVVIALAIKRLRQRDVNWIPKVTHPDPEVRESPIVSGEYQAEEDNFFHGVFEGYYSGLAGPRIWLAVIEMFIGFVDTLITAVVWDEILVLSVLIGLYGLLFLLFLTLGPFVDTIEGRLVLAIGFADLTLLILELLSTLGNYDTADTIDNVAIAIATASVVIGSLITIYCDIIPISLTIWEWARVRFLSCLGRVGLMVPVLDETYSEWSALSLSDSMISKSKSRSGSGPRSTKKKRRATSGSVPTTDGTDEDEAQSRERAYKLRFNLSTKLWRRRRAKPWEPPVDEDRDEEEGEGEGEGEEEEEEESKNASSDTPRRQERQIVPDDQAMAMPPEWWQHGEIENIFDLQRGGRRSSEETMEEGDGENEDGGDGRSR